MKENLYYVYGKVIIYEIPDQDGSGQTAPADIAGARLKNEKKWNGPPLFVADVDRASPRTVEIRVGFKSIINDKKINS